MHKVTIMAKPGCQRCEQIAEAIRKTIRVPVIIEIVDITQDQDLLEKYREDVPVVLIDGVERFRKTVDLQQMMQFQPGILGYTS